MSEKAPIRPPPPPPPVKPAVKKHPAKPEEPKEPPPAPEPIEAEAGLDPDELVDVELEEPIDSARPRPRSVPPPIAYFGRFELLGRMATGGMADIYLAHEQTEGGASRYLVIKMVKPALAASPQFEDLFLREGKVLMRLNHPNICHVYELGKHGRRLFIAMEYIRGAQLRNVLRRLVKSKRKLPVPLAVSIAAEVAGALDYAHRARDGKGKPLRIVHRDVSPHNIMVTYDGAVKLLDFGVARDTRPEHATRSGVMKGKIGYVAPEQARGGAVDGRADVFSLGICLYESIVGRRLYKRDDEYATLKAIIEDPPPSLRAVDPAIPWELDQIVVKALAKKPENRYATAGEMEEALLGFLSRKREVVNAQKVASFMQELFGDEVDAEPPLESGPEILDALGHTAAIRLPDDDVATKRPPSAEKGRQDPSESFATGATELMPSDPGAAPPKTTARPRWVLPVAIAAVLVVVNVGAWLAFSSGGAGDEDALPPAALEPPDEEAVASDPPSTEQTATEAPADDEPDVVVGAPTPPVPGAEPPEPPPVAEAPPAEPPAGERPPREEREERAEREERSGRTEGGPTKRLQGSRSPGFVTDPGF